MDVILAGISDPDIRRDAISMSGIQEKSNYDVVDLIEDREVAPYATPMSSISAMSSYKHAMHPRPPAASGQKIFLSVKDCQASETTFCPECSKSLL